MAAPIQGAHFVGQVSLQIYQKWLLIDVYFYYGFLCWNSFLRVMVNFSMMIDEITLVNKVYAWGMFIFYLSVMIKSIQCICMICSLELPGCSSFNCPCDPWAPDLHVHNLLHEGWTHQYYMDVRSLLPHSCSPSGKSLM